MIRLTFDNPDGASVWYVMMGHPMLTAKAITPCGLLQVLPNSNFLHIAGYGRNSESWWWHHCRWW